MLIYCCMVSLLLLIELISEEKSESENRFASASLKSEAFCVYWYVSSRIYPKWHYTIRFDKTSAGFSFAAPVYIAITADE